MKITIVIKVTHVAGSKPSVIGENFGGLIWKIPIARKDIRPLRQDFAHLVTVNPLFFFESVRIDPNFYAGKWLSNAISSRLSRQVQREQRRCLSETIANGNLPAEGFEFRSQLWIECRVAGSKQPQLFAKTFVQRAKQELAGAQTE